MNDTFLTPDYYPAFSCKMGKCRNACCEGWPISLSIADYHKLIGIGCSSELRRKLDIAMHVVDYPTLDVYAQITPNYQGTCPMRLEDGRCSLQAELGEKALASVCRLYPRGIRLNGERECSCANSCEAVLELFLTKSEPIVFMQKMITIAPPEIQNQPHKSANSTETEIRRFLISSVQDRQCPLKDRLLFLLDSIPAIKEILKTGASIERLKECKQSSAEPNVHINQQEQGLKIFNAFIDALVSESQSVQNIIDTVLCGMPNITKSMISYTQASNNLEIMLPSWETWFEHILVNHMFFTQFPFQNPPVVLKEKFTGLCATYSMMRYLCVVSSYMDHSIEKVVDSMASLFRLADHTSFDIHAASVLKKVGCLNRRDIAALVSI